MMTRFPIFWKISLTPPQIITLGFIVVITVGTFLLTLPIATSEPISVIDALFTATSATTVTGLVVLDTGTEFTMFGQIVIMVLIQLGGLGLMTFAILIVLLLGKKIGLRERILVQETFNQSTLGGLIRLVKSLLIFALDEKLWASYFQAVTPRTAGFNSLDIGSMNPGTLTLTMFLMFIGAGSASTGSGIKLTTFIVIVLAVHAYLRGKKEAVIFKRSIPNHVVHRALAITVISLLMVTIVIFILSITENGPYLQIIFEAFSAFGTVGLSMGLTSELSENGKLLLCILMLAGRIGPVTLAFALARTAKGNIRYPNGDVFTG